MRTASDTVGISASLPRRLSTTPKPTNTRIPRNNVLQAILLDIVLVLLTLAFDTLLGSLAASFAVRTLGNTIFLGTVVLVLFSVVQSLRGKEADIPTVSEAVRMQLY